MTEMQSGRNFHELTVKQWEEIISRIPKTCISSVINQMWHFPKRSAFLPLSLFCPFASRTGKIKRQPLPNHNVQGLGNKPPQKLMICTSQALTNISPSVYKQKCQVSKSQLRFCACCACLCRLLSAKDAAKTKASHAGGYFLCKLEEDDVNRIRSLC